jgi:sugar phosphate isomerase/epimerase
MDGLGIEYVHLAVGPVLQERGDEYLSAVNAQSWTISSTMVDFPQEDYSSLESIRLTGGVVPDDQWPRNRDLFQAAADVTADLGVEYMSMHAGFIDSADPESAGKVADRIRALADVAAERKIMLLMETGQETAAELRRFIEEMNHPAVGVNFDPANMILYDKGGPIEAVRTLSPWIKHVHVKDAIRTRVPGTWGVEVPWGEGQVGSEAFLDVLNRTGFAGVLAIERESGDDRVGDISVAVERLRACSS